MDTIRFCPGCRKPLAPDAPQGLCPACLLKAALDPASNAPSGVAATPAGTENPPSLHEVTQLFPQLEIIEVLGQGGMGVVYKARQKQLDRIVALKIMLPQFSRDPEFVERFNREARALAKLNHPNIVAVYDFGQAGGQCYFLMEFVDGANLRSVIHSGKLTSAEALAIVPKLCDALQFAHDEGVVHRDIKPANILVDCKGRVKIADFGLAKLAGATAVSLTRSQQGMGTPQYMAPEQMGNAKTVDHRADIYSLGVVFYEMLTGELPMGRFASPSQKVEVDVRLDEIVLRSLERDVERRYQHASEVKTDLETISRSPTPSSTDVRAGANESGQRPGENFATRMMPRDLTDILVPLVLTPIMIGLLVILPAFVVSVLFHTTSIELPLVVSVLIFLGLMTLLGLGSVQSVTVDGSGLTMHRNLGPSHFLSWSCIVQIQAMSRPEAIRQVMVWPGFPPRGSILGMSSLHFYRISCQDDCWHFAPRDPEQFLEAVSRWQSAAAAALKLSPSGKTSAVKTVFEDVTRKPQAVPVASPSPAAPRPVSTIEPRFSRAAILGAVWALFGLLSIVPILFFSGLNRVWNGTALPTDIIHEAPPAAFTIFMGVLLVIGAGAPIGTTVLGAISISNIKKSAGKLLGLPLAFADAVFFPLLLLDVLLCTMSGAALVFLEGKLQFGHIGAGEMVLLESLLAIVGDFLIVRALWRKVNPATVNRPESKPKRGADHDTKTGQLIQNAADGLLMVASTALFTALCIGVGLGVLCLRDGTSVLSISKPNMIGPNPLIGMAIFLFIYALFLGVAGLQMRRLRWRLYVLLCTVIGGLFVPVMLIFNVVMERVAEWLALIPVWLGIPVAAGVLTVLFRADVRAAFATAGKRPGCD